MNEQLALQIGKEALVATVMLSAPPLLFGLAVGLVVSIFQAVTQINEMTLAFVPKILAVFVAFAFFGPWMLNTMVTYTNTMFAYLPQLVK